MIDDNKIVVDREKLNSYKLKITVLSPVHVGTGEVYEPTNYVIDKDVLYGFDDVLFYHSLGDEDRKSFTGKLNNYMQIIDFYKSKKEEAKKIAFFECKVSKEVFKKYDAKYNKDGSKNKNQLEIQTTFKNPNTHRAIIPGSSIKGMLDTALKIYPPKASNEIRQNLIVSDAILVDGGVEIGFANRVHRNPQKSSKKGIYQIIEVIAPKSTFVFSLESRFSFAEICKGIKSYQSKRENSRYKESRDSFVTKIGKNVGMDYVVEIDDISRLKNRDGRPLATHFLYSSDTLSDEEFGWINIELIDEESFKDATLEIESKERSYRNNLKQRQKGIKDNIKRRKDEIKKLALEKQLKAEMEIAEAKRKKQEEKKRLESLSPFELEIEKLQKNEPSTPKHTLIFNGINSGKFTDKKEALDYLVALLKKENLWKESTKKKNPKKDKDYQRTLKIIEMLQD